MGGYDSSGDTTLQCSIVGVLSTTHACTERVCDAYTAMPSGVEGGTVDGCADDQVLTAVNDPSCSLKCKKGRVNTVKVASTLTCTFPGIRVGLHPSRLSPPLTLARGEVKF